MKEYLTISGIACTKIYLGKYYNKDKTPLPLMVNTAIWNDIHNAYYGGRVEAYNPIVK